MITHDTLKAAEEAFGTNMKQKPYIGMKMWQGDNYLIFNKTHDKIYQAYLKDKTVVNDDADLFATIAEPLWDYSESLKENLRRLPREGSITRRRRELHQYGYIEYSKEKKTEREEAFNNEVAMHSPIPPQVRGRDLDYGWDVNEGNGVGISAPQVQTSLLEED